ISLHDALPIYSQNFSSDGNQPIDLSVSVGPAQITGSTTSAKAHFTLQAGKYWWNASQNKWVDSTITPVDDIDIDLSVQPFPNSNNQAFAFKRYQTTTIPSDADGDLIISFGTIGAYVEGREYGANLTINNAITEKNSVYIDYQLTSDRNSQNVLELDDTWFGDGPYDIPSALRYSGTGLSLTEDSWQLRGSTSYRNYHKNLLKEALDIQRINTRKLEAEVWGAYDPTKVLEYNGDYWFYAGGSYSGVSGEWNITLMKLSVNKASSDIFKDIPKFSDDDDSGSDDTGTQPPDGGITDHGLLSGLNDPSDHPWALQTDFSNVDDWAPADNRFLNESANLSDLASIGAARGNLDVFSKGQSDNRYLQIANNLSEITLITGNKTFDSPINLSNNSPIKASGDNAIE